MMQSCKGKINWVKNQEQSNTENWWYRTENEY